MTIKSKLTRSSLFFISLIIITGLITLGSNIIQRQYSEQIIKSISLNHSIRIISDEFKNIEKTIQKYILLNDDSEISSYKISYNNIIKQINIWGKIDKTKSEYFLSKFIKINDIINKIISIYNSDNRIQIMNIMEKEFIPYKNSLEKELLNEVKKSELNIISVRKKANYVVMNTTILSILIIILAIIIGVIVSIRIYRSIVHPLRILCDGVEKFGKAELYHHIELKSKNEFSELADAFNKMVENIKKLESQIVQVDRLSSIGQLAGGIAHEINNPLSGVLGQTQIILEKLEPNNPVLENVKKIERAAKRCKESISKLLQYSRQREYEFKYTSIHELIEDTLALADSDLKANNIRIERKFNPSIPDLSVSSPHIQQVFLNIINNAIQAMPTGGILSISTSTVEFSNSNNTKKFVEISIKDTGVGISNENIKKIFEPFFSTKPKDKSAGIGLTISNEIIKRHNGYIIAESEGPGKGSVFKVMLPI